MEERRGDSGDGQRGARRVKGVKRLPHGGEREQGKIDQRDWSKERRGLEEGAMRLESESRKLRDEASSRFPTSGPQGNGSSLCKGLRREDTGTTGEDLQDVGEQHLASAKALQRDRCFQPPPSLSYPPPQASAQGLTAAPARGCESVARADCHDGPNLERVGGEEEGEEHI
eukprot:755482-Hanusia_phi.AAC.7